MAEKRCKGCMEDLAQWFHYEEGEVFARQVPFTWSRFLGIARVKLYHIGYCPFCGKKLK